MSSNKSSKYTFKKRHLVEVVSILALLGLTLLFKISADQLKNESKSNLATLTISLGTSNRSFEGEVVSHMTVLDALNMAASVGNIKLNYTLDENNETKILEINGHRNGKENNNFIFLLNEERISSENINKVELKPGDSVIIKYE